MAMNTSPARARGFTLIEVLVALIISMIALGAGTRAMVSYYENQALEAAAQHLERVAQGAADYIADNRAAITAAAGATTPYVVTADDLTAGGYLPGGFNPINAFGQAFEARVIQPTPGVLEAVLFTTGGDTLAGSAAIRGAQMLGAAGGFVPADDTEIVKGSFGGWQVELGPYDITPGAGRFAMAMFLSEAADAALAADAPTVAQVYDSSTASINYGSSDGGYVWAICPQGWVRKRGGYRASAGGSLSADMAAGNPPGVSEAAFGAQGWRVKSLASSCTYCTFYAWVECVPE